MPVFSSSPSGVTLNDLIEETRSHLFSGQAEEMNRISAGIGSGDTSIPLSYPVGSMVTQGCVISIDLEEIRVWATDGSQTLTTVERGINGTTAATHAINANVYVQPKFSPFKIARAINEELADLSSPFNGLFAVATLDLTYNAAVQGYDLTGVTDIIRVLEARYQVPGPSNNWPKVERYSLQRNMPTSTFSSGFVFDTYQRAFPGLPIHLRYATHYGTLVDLTDDITVIAGLPLRARALPPVGAAIRLVLPREVKRNFSEAGLEPRRMEEVPPQAVMRSVGGLQLLRSQMISAERANLAQEWPWVSEVA